MTWKAIQWPIPLHKPPQVVYLGRGVFGQHPIRRYQLPDLWCFHVYTYHAELVIDGQVFPIRPGYASITPPGAELEYRFRERSVHIASHFKYPKLRRGMKSEWIPAMLDLGSAFTSIHDAMEEGMGFLPTSPERAASRLWDLLWQVAELGRGRQEGAARAGIAEHPDFLKAQGIIEQKLETSLKVTELAADVGLSHNHLTRLFRAALGQTVREYIRVRRVSRARHLLEKSSLPIKVIAAEVGLPDLHQFNKTIRRELGDSPRAVRERSGNRSGRA